MLTKNDVTLYPIIDVFSISNREKRYIVPLYQRPYTWEKKNIVELLTDIIDHENGYYLGSYMCICENSQDSTFLLIDGQQRFTTIALCFLAIFKLLEEYTDGFNEFDKQKYRDLKDQIVYMTIDSNSHISYVPRLELQKQNNNKIDYLCLLSEKLNIDLSINTKNNYKGNRRIYKNYNEIYAFLKNINDKQKLFDVWKKINSATLISITVNNPTDAYILFESINDRGMPLSAMDLIKNKFISKALDDDKKAERIYNTWKEILENIGEDNPAIQERFLIHYYNVFHNPLLDKQVDKEKKRYASATKSNVIEKYTELADSNPEIQETINDILEKSKLYSNFIPDIAPKSNFNKEMDYLDKIQATPSYQLLLYLLFNKDSLKLTDDNIKEIINLLIKFSVRRSFTSQPRSKAMIDIFLSIISDIENTRKNNNDIINNKFVYNTISTKLKNVSAEDSDFMKKLQGPIYDDNPEATKFILRYYENETNVNNKEKVIIDFEEKDSSGKKPKWTVEHVFPEGKNLYERRPEWVDMIANGDKELAKSYSEDLTHTLGNLTITARNSELSDKPFNEKKDYYNKVVNLELNKDIVDKEKWTKTEIDERTNKLATKIVEMMKLD